MNHEITSELKSHFLRLYKLALADDNFGVLELQVLYLFAEERGVPRTELDKLLNNPTDHDASIPTELTQRIEYLYHLATMILYDEVVTEEERSMLRKFCRKFEFLDENVDSLAEYLLDCVKQNVSLEEIINQVNA